jgi:hypothetical protein
MPGGLSLKKSDPVDIPTPGADHSTVFIDDTVIPPVPSYKDEDGVTRSMVGSTGATGSAGPTGTPGFAFDGEDGDTIVGPSGLQGIQGIQGNIGPIGPAGFGFDGDDGDFMPALPGPQGNPGPTGATGDPGPAGASIPSDDGSGGSSDPDILSNPQTIQIVPTFPDFSKGARNIWWNANRLALPGQAGVTGVTTSGTVPVASSETNGYYINCSTTTGNPNASYLTSGSSMGLQRRFGCILNIFIKTGSVITVLTNWLGFFEAAPGTAASTLTNTGAIGFRYSTTAGDGGWVGYTQVEGVGGASSVVAIPGSTSVLADTDYKLTMRIVDGGASVYYSVNDGPEVIKSDNLLTNTLTMELFIGLVSREAVIKTLKFRLMTFKSGF